MTGKDAMQGKPRTVGMLLAAGLLVCTSGCSAIDRHLKVPESSNGKAFAAEHEDSQARAQAYYQYWPEKLRSRRQMLRMHPVSERHEPYGYGSRGRAGWFGATEPQPHRSAPAGPVPAQAYLGDEGKELQAMVATSWAWQDGLNICWPNRHWEGARVEHVYFPAGAAPDDICVADVQYGRSAGGVQVGLFDIGLSPQAWLKQQMNGEPVEYRGWRKVHDDMLILFERQTD